MLQLRRQESLPLQVASISPHCCKPIEMPLSQKDLSFTMPCGSAPLLQIASQSQSPNEAASADRFAISGRRFPGRRGVPWATCRDYLSLSARRSTCTAHAKRVRCHNKRTNSLRPCRTQPRKFQPQTQHDTTRLRGSRATELHSPPSTRF